MGHSLRTDKLTGTYNRDYLFNQFRRIREFELKQGPGTHPFTLMFIDLDDLKEINDNHGHDSGDEVVILLIDMATAEDVQATEE